MASDYNDDDEDAMMNMMIISMIQYRLEMRPGVFRPRRPTFLPVRTARSRTQSRLDSRPSRGFPSPIHRRNLSSENNTSK